MGEKRPITFRYRFAVKGKDAQHFDLRLNAKTLNLLNRHEMEDHPDWTKLEFHQCPNCPLTPDTHPYCPVAVNISELFERFNTFMSYEEADVIIESEERTFHNHVPLQKGISALLGIYMVSNCCPIMEKLKPMVRHHLPFASPDETLYRAMAMYLMAQYLILENGGEPHWNMDGLLKIYADVKQVNKGMSERVRDIMRTDASKNALVILDCFVENAKFMLNTERLGALRRIFRPYLAAEE